MWRLYVLANHLIWCGLLEVGLAMLDGSYYMESIGDDRNFHGVEGPSADIAGWGGDA
jgi:hypothetical protein